MAMQLLLPFRAAVRLLQMNHQSITARAAAAEGKGSAPLNIVISLWFLATKSSPNCQLPELRES